MPKHAAQASAQVSRLHRPTWTHPPSWNCSDSPGTQMWHGMALPPSAPSVDPHWFKSNSEACSHFLHRFTAIFSNYTTASSSYTIASSPVTLQPPSVTLQPSPPLHYSHPFRLSPQDTYPHQPVSASPVSPHLPGWLMPSSLLILLPFCSLPYLFSSLPLKICFSLMPRSKLMSLRNPFKIL